jgi:hypothetical protein
MLFDTVARQVGRTMPSPVREWVRGHREADLPSPEVRPSTIAKWWIDEYLLQQEIAMSRLRLPNTDFRRRLRDELGEGLDLFSERGWLRDPASYHLDPPTPTADEITITDRSDMGVAYERLRMPSHYRPPCRRTRPGPLARLHAQRHRNRLPAAPPRPAPAVDRLPERLPHRIPPDRLRHLRRQAPAPQARPQRRRQRRPVARPPS